MIKVPEGVTIEGIKSNFSQESGSCDESNKGQYLKVFTANAGGGNFLVIKTKRWAINADEIDAFAQMLKDTLKVSGNE